MKIVNYDNFLFIKIVQMTGPSRLETACNDSQLSPLHEYSIESQVPKF